MKIETAEPGLLVTVLAVMDCAVLIFQRAAAAREDRLSNRGEGESKSLTKKARRC
jgi:hypothetical protein